jgi:hypothetical protein
VLELARSLDRLTTAKQQRLQAADLQLMATVGLIASEGRNHHPAVTY